MLIAPRMVEQKQIKHFSNDIIDGPVDLPKSSGWNVKVIVKLATVAI